MKKVKKFPKKKEICIRCYDEKRTVILINNCRTAIHVDCPYCK